MTETSLTLLDSLRVAEDSRAWDRLVDLYGPLIRGYLRRRQLGEQDVDDVTQEVLILVMRKIPQFERQEQVGSFRSWLRKITYNCLRDHARSSRRHPRGGGDSQFQEMLQQLADPQSDLSRLWNKEHDDHVVQYLCNEIRPEFRENTWNAFYRTTIKNEDSRRVAQELEMSLNAVQVAKSRVLKRMRDYGSGLLNL